MSDSARRPVGFRAIAAYLEESIAAGGFSHKRRLPSEMELVSKFHTSRQTVVRAMLYLQHRGVIERLAGSGTYFRQRTEEV